MVLHRLGGSIMRSMISRRMKWVLRSRLQLATCTLFAILLTSVHAETVLLKRQSSELYPTENDHPKREAFRGMRTQHGNSFETSGAGKRDR
jgi:hypothetical protein